MSIKTNVDSYVQGKTWWHYVPLWFFGLYVYVELFKLSLVDERFPLVLLIPYSFDFTLHELAHIVTAFFPAVICASAGSFSELALGTTLVVIAFWQRSYFTSLFCFLWLELTCQSAGQYMADAIPQRMHLVSLGAMISGGEPRHDWNFVFGQLHLLGASVFIGDTIRGIGVLAGAFGLFFSAWLTYRMSQAPKEGENSKRDELLRKVTSSSIDDFELQQTKGDETKSKKTPS